MSLRSAIVLAHNDLACAKVKLADLQARFDGASGAQGAIGKAWLDVDRAQRRLEAAALEAMSDEVLGT